MTTTAGRRPHRPARHQRPRRCGDGPLGIAHDAARRDRRRDRSSPSAPAGAPPPTERIDAGGRCVLPGFVDSHTHLVFAGDRATEFAARMAGRPYEAGGINVTVGRHPGGDRRRAAGAGRGAGCDEARRAGITTVEIKSGYGLTATDEARCLRLAAELTDETTFLGAHVVPPEYAGRADDYVELVCGEMLAACAPRRPLDRRRSARRGAFDADQMPRRARRRAGARASGSASTPTSSGPVPASQLAVEMGCASADHCTYLDRRRRRGAGRRARPWRRSCRPPTSPPASPTRTPGGSSTPAPPSRWRPTATPARATRRRWRSASRSPCATCA